MLITITFYYRYLERILSILTDSYEVAIVTYALQLAGSPAQETAFGRLHSLRRESGKFQFAFNIALIQ